MISRHCLDLEVSGRNASSDLFVPAFRLTLGTTGRGGFSARP